MLDDNVVLPPSQFEAWFVSLAHDNQAIEQTVQGGLIWDRACHSGDCRFVVFVCHSDVHTTEPIRPVLAEPPSYLDLIRRGLAYTEGSSFHRVSLSK